ncbi:methyl-accepting chemotaxis protein [Sphaerospermopsis aphanizomenoides BCCUSP55]|uniref:HAMP domain-containing methyl-accepting chemotaxis protein n=1 Tax=Sphaerospermopsis aphanizomenoides TaxID=459663 RepID=UPI0019067E30|nr:methyl-accepting chemotaxis protein [Sphaerospermopsis aphanizomenoides]MBK1988791.1 methyl-accepting chemotaxis protein [Sphaerospermopsis aphanizomenoides BCCUSP55]
MLKNVSLQVRLISGFLLIGLIVLIVAIVGWSVNARLIHTINVLSANTIPSITGLWKINEGKTQIEASEHTLLSYELTLVERNAEVTRIQKAWEQIDEGFNEYEATDKTDEEKREYAQFQNVWNEWKQNHERFMQMNQQFESLGILNPLNRELELIKLNQANSPEIELARQANSLLAQLRQQSIDNHPSLNAATKLLIEDIQLSEKNGHENYKQAQRDAATGSFLLLLALIFGPVTAIGFGFYFSKPIVSKIEELVKVSQSIANNNSLASMQISDRQDEIGKLQTAFYTVASKIGELVNFAQKISSGDLTTQIQHTAGTDEIGKLQNAFYAMNQDLNSLIRRIQQSGVQITTSSTQIAASGKQLEATVNEQFASTNQVAATAQEIASTSRNLVQMMEKVADMTKITATSASESHDELQEMEDTMRQLIEATNSITAKLGIMNKKATNINNVVVTITKVADQTSILSLNAAIEAEKAGEYGAGFAVVSREIRRLANQTAVATLEIEQIVKDMQSAVAVGVMEMDKFNNSVNNSVEQVNRISNQIGKVINQVQSLPPQFIQVSECIEEQSDGAAQISEAIEQLTEASQQTVDALRETNGALEQLEEAAQSLREGISHFHIQN